MVCIFLLVQIVHFRTWKLYEAAEEKKVAVPVYNAIVLMKIIGRPSCGLSYYLYQLSLSFFPVVCRNTKKLWKTIRIRYFLY
jgi:signal peptidase I